MARKASRAANPARSAAPPKAWQIHFFKRHRAEDENEIVPGRDFLDACPDKVRAMMVAVLRIRSTNRVPEPHKTLLEFELRVSSLSPCGKDLRR